MRSADEALFVEYRKLIHGRLPVVSGSPLVGGDVLQGQPDQLGSGLITGKVPAGFDDFAQPRIDAFDRVGGVDHLAYRWRKREKGDDFVPGPPPGGDDGRVRGAT